MAKLITLKVLYEDQETETKIIEVLGNIPDVLDISIKDVGTTNSALDDSIANGRYSKGDAFRLWVLRDNNHDQYWQNQYWSDGYGWGDVNLATRYESTDSPRSDHPFLTPAFYILDPTRQC